MRWDAEVSAAVNQARTFYGITVEPSLVHAVIERESAHRDTSPAGTLEPNGHRSYGPMQVQDSTAQAHGISDPKTLTTPSLGIRIGTFELAKLLRQFPDDSARAIAAYNAGPGNSARNPTTGRFVNQAYVDAVLGFWNRYKTGVLVAAPLAALVALGLWWWLSSGRRPRLAWR